MEAGQRAAELAGPLELLPPVDFCCAYGSSLLPNNTDKTSMVDYILGVADPVQWHAENLERNGHHYSKWMARLGPTAVNWVADRIGVGVHFNPFVVWRDKNIKYGVVRMHDLAMDVLTWNRFYLSGRLQKPVHFIVDNWDIRKVNLLNLKAATSASLLLLPAKFSEEDLYATICGLSYKGDLRMLFAEDKNKVKNIIRGSFTLFQSMYKPILEEYASEGLLKITLESHHDKFEQDCGSSATNNHLCSLPWAIQSQLSLKHKMNAEGIVKPCNIVASRELAASLVTNTSRRIVMMSSGRQAISGLIATGGVNAARYFSRKLSKAWKSRTA
ncbi:phosphatidate cytidylyltransferase, mitochondrial-like [Zingiber officinale]|uniref:phosphatidate cytidylyltransferase, mitochondrial-like n=1 Tax=Zingiber officinale TaxID=94328 RepID=UPI001C4ABFFD|nr:phosphatidate cytidylyltransferase, mitochondrial-like [Zingiber officinale]